MIVTNPFLVSVNIPILMSGIFCLFLRFFFFFFLMLGQQYVRDHIAEIISLTQPETVDCSML